MAISYINKKALEKDVEKYLKTFAEAYADTAANEITKFAQQAIQRFYDYYTPKYYDRTDDLKKNSFSKYKHNNGNQYYGGVRISTYNMSPYVVGGLNNRRFIDPFYIARPAWEKGIHGSENGINGRYSAHRDAIPPLEVLQKEVDKLQFRKKIENIARNAAKKQQYQFLRFK